MKKEMRKLHLGVSSPDEIINGILKGDIPAPSCIFCREVKSGTIVVFSSFNKYAFCSVCCDCVKSEDIEKNMQRIRERLAEIYAGGENIKLDEQMFKGKIVSREIGEA